MLSLVKETIELQILFLRKSGTQFVAIYRQKTKGLWIGIRMVLSCLLFKPPRLIHLTLWVTLTEDNLFVYLYLGPLYVSILIFVLYLYSGKMSESAEDSTQISNLVIDCFYCFEKVMVSINADNILVHFNRIPNRE